MMPASTMSYIAESPIPGGSAYSVLRVGTAPTQLTACVGASLAGRPITALVFRRNGNSYDRVAVIAARTDAKPLECPELEVHVTLPPLELNASYVVGFFVAPIAQPGIKPSQVLTTGSALRLQPLLYVGVSAAQ